MDNGQTFEHIGIVNEPTLAVEITNDDILFVSGTQKLYKSYDLGDSFEIASEFMNGFPLIVTPDNILYAGLFGGSNSYIHKSDDLGNTWANFHEGITNPFSPEFSYCPDGYLFLLSSESHHHDGRLFITNNPIVAIIDPLEPQAEIDIHPNPFQDLISIKFLSVEIEDNPSVYLTCLKGKIVARGLKLNDHTFQIHTSNLSIGVYLLVINGKRSIKSIKMIKTY
jgi:hypothetical protein